MPIPVTFSSNEFGSQAGFDFATQTTKVNGSDLHIPAGQEVFGQPNFANGTGTITSATVPWCLDSAVADTFSSAKTLASGCSRLILKAESSLGTADAEVRVWWRDASATTHAWFPGETVGLLSTGVASNSAGLVVPGFRAAGFHLGTALVPVLGDQFKIEVLTVGGGVLSLWCEGI